MLGRLFTKRLPKHYEKTIHNRTDANDTWQNKKSLFNGAIGSSKEEVRETSRRTPRENKQNARKIKFHFQMTKHQTFRLEETLIAKANKIVERDKKKGNGYMSISQLYSTAVARLLAVEAKKKK